jgi:hypothetical protein
MTGSGVCGGSDVLADRTEGKEGMGRKEGSRE